MHDLLPPRRQASTAPPWRPRTPAAPRAGRADRPARSWSPRVVRFAVRNDAQFAGALGIQTPRLALRGPVQPALPVPVAIRLVAEELDPRERARVLDVLGRRADVALDQLDELVVEREVELGLVPAEPYRGLIATRICRGPGGSCRRICPRICPRGRFWAIVVESEIPVCRDFLRGERRDSNPRPPGPQPGSSGASEWFCGSVEPFELSSVVSTCSHICPRICPRPQRTGFISLAAEEAPTATSERTASGATDRDR